MLTTAPLHNQTWHPSGMCLTAAGPRAATVITQADGRFIVEPARPDDSLDALLRTARACLGRPIEKLLALGSALLQGIGPVGADAARLPVEKAAGNGANHDDTIETVIPPQPESGPTGMRAAAESGPRASLTDAGGDRVLITFLTEPGPRDPWDGLDARMQAIKRNLRDSVRAASAESPATAELVARALRHAQEFTVFAPDAQFVANATSVRIAWHAADRLVLVGPWFNARHMAGHIIRMADRIAATHEPGRHGPRVTNRASLEACARKVLDGLRSTVVCLTQGPELPSTCASALRLAKAVEHRRIENLWRADKARAEVVRAIHFAGDAPVPGGALGFATRPDDGTLEDLDEEAVAAVGYAPQRDGDLEQLTPARIRTAAMPTPRALTPDEARLAHLYELSTLIAVNLHALNRPPGVPAPDGKLRESLLAVMPLDTLRQTCPTVFLTPPDTASPRARPAQVLQSRRT